MELQCLSFYITFRTTSMIGLLLIATGTGGIKPCVAAFGGDQVNEYSYFVPSLYL